MRRKVGRLPNHRSNRARTYSLQIILNEIRTGRTSIGIGNLADYTAQARKFHAMDTNAYKGMKVDCPAFCPAGTLDRQRQVIEPSGYLLIEFDDLGTETGYIHHQISEMPATTAVFHTLSGEGLAAIVTLADIPEDAESHRHAWLAAMDYYSHIAEADISDAKQNQLRAICYDPGIYTNPSSQPLQWEVNDIAYKSTFAEQLQARRYVGENSLTEEYFEAIRRTEWHKHGRSKGWSVDAVPCPMEEHAHDGWDSTSNRCHVRCLDDTPGYLFHCFKCGQKMRYTFPPTR